MGMTPSSLITAGIIGMTAIGIIVWKCRTDIAGITSMPVRRAPGGNNVTSGLIEIGMTIDGSWPDRLINTVAVVIARRVSSPWRERNGNVWASERENFKMCVNNVRRLSRHHP